MKNRKRIALLLIVALTAVCGLTACGGATAAQQVELIYPDPVCKGESFSFGFSLSGMTNDDFHISAFSCEPAIVTGEKGDNGYFVAFVAEGEGKTTMRLTVVDKNKRSAVHQLELTVIDPDAIVPADVDVTQPETTTSTEEWVTQTTTVQTTTATTTAATAAPVNNTPTQPVKYTVTFYANGGRGAPDFTTVVAGDSITLPTPTRNRYIFKGWYTATNGGTKLGDGGDSYKVTGKVALYAQWTAEPTLGTITLAVYDSKLNILPYDADAIYYCRAAKGYTTFGVTGDMPESALTPRSTVSIFDGWLRMATHPYSLTGKGLSTGDNIVVVKVQNGKVVALGRTVLS